MRIRDVPETHVNEEISVTIPSGENTTPSFDMGGAALCMLGIDSNLSGATLSFLVSLNPPNDFGFLYDATTSALITIVAPTVASGDIAWIKINPSVFAGARLIKVQSSITPSSDAVVLFGAREV